MEDDKFWDLVKQIKETAKGDLDAIAKLTLDQIRDLVGPHIEADQAVVDSARVIAEIMGQQKTEQVVAVGLSLVMLGMELLAKDLTEIPFPKRNG